MKLKSGAHLEERAGKTVYLVLDGKEIQLTGTLEQIVTKLYYNEMSEAELEEVIPGAHQALERLSDWIE